MDWKFWKKREPEKRDTSWSDAISRLMHLEAGGGFLSHRNLISAEISAGVVGRAFATLSVKSASDSISMALTPIVLAEIGRQLVLNGESVFYIDVDSDGLQLIPSANWTVEGGHYRRSRWQYRIYLSSPTGGQTTMLVPADDVIHVQHNFDIHSPWIASGSLQKSPDLVRGAGRTEKSVSNTMSSPTGKIIPAPISADQGDHGQAMQRHISAMEGGVALVESMGSGFGNPVRHEARSTMGDWRIIDLSPAVDSATAALLQLYTVLGGQVNGIPAELLTAGSSASKREGIRQLLFGTLKPLSLLLQHELRMKLDSPDLILDFAETGAQDILSRSRSVASLVQSAGVPLDEALHLAGFRE